MRWLACVWLLAACGDNTHRAIAIDAPSPIDAPALDTPRAMPDAPPALAGTCATPCDLGQICAIDADCASGACDAISHVCVGGTCYDHRVDHGESDQDCGGNIDCAGCAAGRHCQISFDCMSGTFCNPDGICAASTCANHVKDYIETDVDCGGGPAGCPACPLGAHCTTDGDCASNACDASTHACITPAAACGDGVRDGDESATDCGGTTCEPCASGVACVVDADCASHACDFATGTCAADHCTDHHVDADETATDCGGATCSLGAACTLGAACAADRDCASTTCDHRLCVPPTCIDHTLDNDETALDCGGTCAPCALGLACAVDHDCASGACDATTGTCIADRCADHRRDADEGDIDCGGTACAACTLGQGCHLDTDCASHTCDPANHTCHLAWCADGAQDRNETDIDCGGGQCPRCTLGAHCTSDLDCAAFACDAISHVCVDDACTDHQWDANETYTDCGGPDCAKRCAVGDGCEHDSDCEPGHTCLAQTVCQ